MSGGVRVSVGRYSNPCTVALPFFHLTRRAARPAASPRSRRPVRAQRRAAPDPFAASTTTWPGVTAPDRTHDDAVLVPVESAMPALRQLARRACARRADHEPAEAVLVATPRELRSVGRPRERPLAGPPCRLRVLVVLARAPDCASPPSGSAVHTIGQPSASLTNARRSPVGREPRLPDADGVAARDDLRSTGVVADDDPRRVPRQIGQIPLVPGEPRSVGRPGRVPRVVGRRSPLRPRAPSRGTTTTSHASSRSIESATSPRTDTAGASARPSRVKRPDDCPRRRDHDGPAVATGHDELVVIDPGVAARRRRTSAVTTTGGADAVGGSDDEIRLGRRGRRPRPSGSRWATSGDRRPNPSGRPSRA